MFCINKELQGGRFGNKFIRNMTIFLLKEKYGFYSSYHEDREFKELGFGNIFNNTGEVPNYEKEKMINDKDIINYLDNNIELDNKIKYKYAHIFNQLPEIIKHIIDYYQNDKHLLCKQIINNNKFKHRYNNNNDVFIHIRCGDIFYSNPLTPNLEYYKNILDSLEEEYDNIYIASDFIHRTECQELIKTYNAKVYNANLIETILFGSTCKYVILSSGSYSFIIGILSFYSKKIYFSTEAGEIERNGVKGRWHDDYYDKFDKFNKYSKYIKKIN